MTTGTPPGSARPSAVRVFTVHGSDAGERTRDLYEQIEHYPKPPLPRIPPLDDPRSLAELGAAGSPGSLRAMRALMRATGFAAFHRTLPERVEEVLRTSNIRGPHLFSPILSATLALADDPARTDPFERAASLLLGACGMYRDLRAGTFAPDTDRGQVLEMGQYPNLFGTSMTVEGGRPRLFKTSHTAQATVLVLGRVYTVEIGPLGAGMSVADLAAVLRRIADDARAAGPLGDAAPGWLTAADHPTQCRAFAALQRDPVNAASLEALRHTLLTLCLDLEHEPATHAEAARLAHSGNAANRWYHASFQLVVFGNARAAGICSFSAYLDGSIMTRAGMEIQRRGAALPAGDPRPAADLPPHRELEWRIPAEALQRARADLARILDDQPATWELDGMGRDFFDAHGLAPVHAFTLALQLAAHRLVGRAVQVTQFLSASRFRCTDLVKAPVTTAEVERFLSLAAGDAPPAALAAAMRQAIDSEIAACREMRSELSIGEALALFFNSRRGVGRPAARLTAGIGFTLMRRLGLLAKRPSEVVISHPVVYPEVPVLGRPGVRLPYLSCFGLHYQIFPDRTVVTVMPGTRWTTPNERLIAELRAALQRLAGIAAADADTPRG